MKFYYDGRRQLQPLVRQQPLPATITRLLAGGRHLLARSLIANDSISELKLLTDLGNAILELPDSLFMVSDPRTGPLDGVDGRKHDQWT